MAEIASKRVVEEQRAAAQGTVCNTFGAAGAGAVRSLELNNISEGETVTIPVDYKVYKLPIAGSQNSAVAVITEEGRRFFIGALTRGAMPANGGEFVRPSGTVVEACQKYGNMDEFFKAEMAGKKIKFTKKTVVVAENRFGGESPTRNVNVWQIDYVA